jgi:DNA-binding MarR family transcriptional regulator
MHSTTSSRPDWKQPSATSVGPSVDSEITWLLHRAAQRMRSATGDQAEKHGIQLRDYIVLSALHKTPNLTQIELGKALGLDKTTLMSQLDRLERMGHVVRRHDPRDRRARIPEITDAGNALRAKVANACATVEAAAVNSYRQDQVQVFRRMLFDIIGDTEDRGSCL